MAGSMPRGARIGMAAAAVAATAVFLTGGAYAQFEKPVSATYDGWSQLPDGSYDLVFGYMNRNAAEIEVPLGTANTIEPAPADQGQPTSFLPGRQRDVFRIHVPKDFKGKFVWTLTFGGTTQTATASLDQNYSLDVGEPEPPKVKAGSNQVIRVGESAALAPSVTAPPPPQAPANPNVVARQTRGTPITIWWSKFRGPGSVAFGDGSGAVTSEGGPTGRTFPMGSFRTTCALPLTAGCGATTARFSAPGTYWLRVVAVERSESNAIVRVQVNR